jgi:2'-5' RNA ligase superfamily
METSVAQPLILTLQLDETAQLFYETLRRRHFPPERNVIPAHLSLFHQLPDESTTYDAIAKLARYTQGFRLTSGIPRSIGRGVAIFFDSPPLSSLHHALSKLFHADLIPQDRQPFRPHIVIQNKVDPAIARETLTQVLDSSFMQSVAVGLTLWRYLGGPWEHISDHPLAA